MTDPITNLKAIKLRIQLAEQKYQRIKGSVSLVAVSKSHSPQLIEDLHQVGQKAFAENYLDEALAKISALSRKDIDWHFIGRIQSNKAREIAQNFSWVHTVCRLKEAKRLSHFRAPHLPPLNICIQIKMDDNPKKSGILSQDAVSLIEELKSLPNLRLRGLMAMAPYQEDFQMQRDYFKAIRELFNEVNKNVQMDTLSMGMTHDFEAAIAEGSTLVRIGTGIFGLRK